MNSPSAARRLLLPALLSCLLGCGERKLQVASDPPSAVSADAALDAGLAADAASDGAPDAAPADAQPAVDSALADVVAIDAGPHIPVQCNDHPCACDDGVDSDGDGLIDGLDPECTGPADDDEASFATGVASERDDACRDCFWDGNSGFGDDGCRYARECFSGGAVQGGGCGDCSVDSVCRESCEDLTPNGCDCFGCCQVAGADGTLIEVVLTETCSLAAIDDPELCPRCRRHPDCRNDCGGCELCSGQRLEDLPASCRNGDDPTPQYRCDENRQVCSAEVRCPPDFYCQLGCCRFIPQ